MNWPDVVLWTEWLLRAAAVVGGLAVIMRTFGTYVVNPMQKREAERTEEMFTKHLSPLTKSIEEIKNEVTFNGGESLKDAVRRLERGQHRIQGKLGVEDYYRTTDTDQIHPNYEEPTENP